MEVCLPDDKLARIQGFLVTWLDKKKATKHEFLSLIGLLQHAAKVVQCGMSFVSRMYAIAAKVQGLEYFTCLNSEFCTGLLADGTHFLQSGQFAMLHLTPHKA